MPPRGRKRKSDADGEQNASECTSVQEPSTARGTRTKPVAKKLAKPLQEYETDNGREGVKTFLKSASAVKKRPWTAADAKREVQKESQKLLGMITEPRRNIWHGFDKSALQKSRDDLVSVLRSGEASAIKQSSEILQQCIKSAATYKSISKRSTGIEQPGWMRWTQDNRDLRSLNKHAFELAVKIAEQGILGAVTGKSVPLQMSRRVGDLEKLAWEMMDEVMPREGKATWGTVAHAQLRALISLSKTLAMEGEQERQL